MDIVEFFSEVEWHYIFNPELAWESLPFLLSGLPLTLGIALSSTFNGLVIGFFLALMRMSKLPILDWIARSYISFMRGTPALVFLFLVYYGLPFISIQFTALTASILAFSLNCAAYISEIIRSALSSVEHGQWEAATALGIKRSMILWKIIVPQATRIAIPPLSNVLLDVIKGTSLTAMVTVHEVFQNARIVGGREHDYMTMYILVAAIYWVICSLFSIGQNYLEAYSSRHVAISK